MFIFPRLFIIYSVYFSCFFLHNETFNIWSHFIGFVIFFYLWILSIFYPPPTASTLDMAPITLQLITYQVQKFIKFTVNLVYLYHYMYKNIQIIRLNVIISDYRSAWFLLLYFTHFLAILRKLIEAGRQLTILESSGQCLEHMFPFCARRSIVIL